MSEAKTISLALSSRLSQIRSANGFSTNIGVRVYRGRRVLDETNVPCITIVEGNDDVSDENRRSAKIGQQYFIEGHDICDPDNPNDKAHDIIADIKRAVFADDAKITPAVRDVKYKGRTIQPREGGANIVAASVEVSIVFVEDKPAP